jgi:hypothetical protein
VAVEGRYRRTEQASLLPILATSSALRIGRRTSVSRGLIYLLRKERRPQRRNRTNKRNKEITSVGRVTPQKDRVMVMTTTELVSALASSH